MRFNDFKNKIEDFLEPLSVFDEIEEVQYRADFAEYDFLSSWFRGQLAEGELEDDLGHLYGLYLGFLLQTNYQRLGATWTLDPRPNSPTYLKPVIGPFACAQPMKYIDPFLYVKESWIEELPMEAHQLVRLVSSWYQDAAEQMSSSPLETHFYRKMNGILPEF